MSSAVTTNYLNTVTDIREPHACVAPRSRDISRQLPDQIVAKLIRIAADKTTTPSEKSLLISDCREKADIDYPDLFVSRVREVTRAASYSSVDGIEPAVRLVLSTDDDWKMVTMP